MSTTDATTRGSVFTDGAAIADEANWHAAVAEIRRSDPVLRVEVEGWPHFWAITRYADIMEIERQHNIFQNTMMTPLQSLATLSAIEETSTQLEMLIQMSGPKHKKYRGLTSDWFKPSALRQTMGDKVAGLARTYVDRMADFDGECDFAQDIAMFYPLRVIMAILGVPEQDEPFILELATGLLGEQDPEFIRSDNQVNDYTDRMLEMFGFFQAIAVARRENPTADLATVIANARIDGEPIGDLETLSYFLIFATAGHDTTANTISAGVEALIRSPDQLQQLRAEPELLGNAIEEMVRWASPVKQFTRTATEDYTLHGTTIRAGELVLLSFASGNRDETVFDDPFRFDIRRPNANRHIGYGFGTHFCLGAPLARMEISSFFSEFLRRVEGAELNGPIERTHSAVVSGIKHLPIRYAMKASPS